MNGGILGDTNDLRTKRFYYGTRAELRPGDLIEPGNSHDTGEVTDWPLYHGTRADLKPGDLIKPGHTSNYGDRSRTTKYVYLARTLDAAKWGAELAVGEGPGRIYLVEPTGPIEGDPNLTNKKFRGNPTKAFRSREPLRVTGEITDWQGHSPEAIKTMKNGLERLKQLGIEVIDD